MMTLLKLPDGKQEYISDLDSTIDLSREYIGSEYTNELREKINDRIIEVEVMYNEEIENLIIEEENADTQKHEYSAMSSVTQDDDMIPVTINKQ